MTPTLSPIMLSVLSPILASEEGNGCRECERRSNSFI